MKNIAVVIDITHDSGGKENMSLSVCSHLSEIKQFNFIYITTYDKTKKILENKLGKKILLYNKNNFLNKLNNRLKRVFSFLPIDYPFQRFLLKKKVDLVYFLDSSSLATTVKKTKFIYSILDIDHRNQKKLKEFKKIFKKRDDEYLFSSKNASKIIIGANKLKKEILDAYKIDYRKIVEIKFPPILTSIDSYQNESIREEILNINKVGNYLLYPAQFWEHKNHIYIVDAVDFLKKERELDFKIIFTGHDKGNLLNIKSIIKNKNLEESFVIFDYVKDEELIYLYKNCSCIIIPTLVAPHTFPLYEAFYFKKPVIYNKFILDEQLLHRVIKLDVNEIENFKEAINHLKDEEFIKKITDDNYQYYKKIFNKNKNTEVLYKLLNTTLNE
ncbi:MAG: glycosyltransferase [Flavobacteriales bacterium TMED235]|nr:MAG: glycosyltransferase [Flavobacteriales bacterium TMED235]|tara:strand:- start:11140 stop:12297 length:1158 start_codon:yes stop_codon:yes gene_type:complete